MSKVPMTVSGEAALREELDRLKKVERPRITEAIAEAREHGDLKENAEYHAAREQQSFNEGRIMEIEGKLGNVLAEVPVADDALPLGVAIDPLAVAAELGIVLGQQQQPGVHPMPEVIEHPGVAVADPHLPVGGDGPVVDQDDVGNRREVLFGLDVSHGGRFYCPDRAFSADGDRSSAGRGPGRSENFWAF